MTIVAIALGVVIASTIAVCVALGRFSRASVLREWEMLLGPRSSSRLDAYEEACSLDGLLADDAWTKASKTFLDGKLAETVRLLELSFEVLEAATAERRVKLRGVAVCAHMAAALAPVRPLVPADYRLRELATLAGAARLVHHVLITGRERLAFKAHVIAFGFRLAVRALRLAKTVDLQEALRRFDDAKADWKTLDRAHVEAVRDLFLSLEAVRRERVSIAPL